MTKAERTALLTERSQLLALVAQLQAEVERLRRIVGNEKIGGHVRARKEKVA